jgi:hypothetical protein
MHPKASSPPTEPNFDSALPRVSDFQRRMRLLGVGGDTMAGSTRLSALDASLLQDLQRFEPGPNGQPHDAGLEVLEVVAAAVRHARALKLMLAHEDRVLPLTVLPAEHLVHAPLPLPQWALLRWNQLKVLHVEPALGQPLLEPGSDHSAPLALVLWALALNGARAELLPEIAGPVAYRIAPGTDLSALNLRGALGAAVTKLRRQTTTLGEMEAWPGFDRERAMRLLNGLYLQAGLMVSRAHPAASGPH